MIIFGVIVLSIYLVSLTFLWVGYYKIKDFKYDSSNYDLEKQSCFSIIIPFRNEADNLPNLLDSLLKLNYSKESFEILFVNDESDDKSKAIIVRKLNNQNINYKIINNQRISASPKKDAIKKAISLSKYDWIITTDADCILPINWLVAFNQCILKNKPSMVAGPVAYFKRNTLINQYQQLDNFSLQTTTVGAFGWNHPILCNGANLAYKKKDFVDVNGFVDNHHIASGDDIFLLNKFKKRKSGGVQFIKNNDSIVKTKPEESWKEIINQRIRWASKTSKQKDIYTLLLGLIAFTTNLTAIVGLIFCLFQKDLWSVYLTCLAIKFIVDFFFILPTSVFFKSQLSIPSFLINSTLYPIITVIVVLKSFQGNYHWKGRAFKSK